jgi:hypothetical protein
MICRRLASPSGLGHGRVPALLLDVQIYVQRQPGSIHDVAGTGSVMPALVARLSGQILVDEVHGMDSSLF